MNGFLQSHVEIIWNFNSKIDILASKMNNHKCGSGGSELGEILAA